MFNSKVKETIIICLLISGCGINIIFTGSWLIFPIPCYLAYRLWDIQKTDKVIKNLMFNANKDALTGLLNRRGLESAWNDLRNDRRNTSQAVMILDIDHFKDINDTYGHDRGDHVLKELAQVVKNQIRSDDIISRWGGEEFVVILSNINASHASHVSEKIRSAIEAHDFCVDGVVTVSIGVNSHCISDSLKDSITIADKGLYQAKENGRNQMVIA
jgi:diguanylate cyclase